MIGKTEGVCCSMTSDVSFRQIGRHRGDPSANIDERRLHVGVAGENDRQLRRTANRCRLDALDSGHRRDGGLQWPRHRDLHHVDRRSGKLGDDNDPRKRDLRVDAVGHPQDRVDARAGCQRREEHDHAEVPTRLGGQVELVNRSASASMALRPPLWPPIRVSAGEPLAVYLSSEAFDFQLIFRLQLRPPASYQQGSLLW